MPLASTTGVGHERYAFERGFPTNATTVTVYDTDSRSQIQTEQKKAALRSLFELQGATGKRPGDFASPS